MDISEIRLRNLNSLLDEMGRGGATKIAKAIGSELSVVSLIKSGKRNMGKDVARRIEESFHKSHGWMDQDHNNSFDNNAEPLQRAASIPLVGMVAAGHWMEANEFEPEEWIECPVKHGERTFAVRVSGESMSPKFEHGEIIFCDPTQQPKHNDYVIAKLEASNQATFKQLIVDGDGNRLKALNPNWQPQYSPINENCTIIGKVIARIERY